MEESNHEADSVGTYIDHGQLVTVRDANDHSTWVGSAIIRPDMTGQRWERLCGRPHSFVRAHVVDAAYHWLYFTESMIVNTQLERCILYNVSMISCTLRNCHLHFSDVFNIEGCVFIDCILTTGSTAFIPGVLTRDGKDVGSSVLFEHGVVLVNCTLRGNFARDFGPFDITRNAENEMMTQLAPYEVHNNVVFRDCVVDCLRRWVWRHRNGIGSQGRSQRSKYFPLTTTLRSCPQGDQPRWRGKAAAKRPMYVHKAYDATEQLELPIRRCEWSVTRTLPAYSSLLKRKQDLTWMNLDD